MNLKFKLTLRVVFLALLVDGHPVLGQEKELPDDSTALVSMVFLGPKAQRKFKKTGGAPIMLPPEEGETPPGVLYFNYKTEKSEKRKFVRTNIPFNQAPRPIKLPSEQVVRFFKTEPNLEKEDEKEYFSIPSLKRGGSYFVVILPKAQDGKMWEKEPISVVLDLLDEEYAGAEVLLINYSGKDVQTLFGSQVEDLPSREKIVYRGVVKGKYIRAASKYKDRKIWIFNRPIKADENTVSVIILYDANPLTNAGRDIGAMFTEIKRPNL